MKLKENLNIFYLFNLIINSIFVIHLGSSVLQVVVELALEYKNSIQFS